MNIAVKSSSLRRGVFDNRCQAATAGMLHMSLIMTSIHQANRNCGVQAIPTANIFLPVFRAQCEFPLSEGVGIGNKLFK